MAIVWTSELNTGIDVIDGQHRRIVDYINELENAAAQNNHLSVGHVLDELVDYTLSHFAFEESLQEKAGYQHAKPHKVTHNIFALRIATFQDRHKAGEDVAEQLRSLLGTWLVHHIKQEDMAYVAEVKADMTKIVEDKKSEGWLSSALQKFFK